LTLRAFEKAVLTLVAYINSQQRKIILCNPYLSYEFGFNVRGPNFWSITSFRVFDGIEAGCSRFIFRVDKVTPTGFNALDNPSTLILPPLYFYLSIKIFG
jgi:hypothetical protein